MQLCYEKKGYSVYAVRIENKNIPQLRNQVERNEKNIMKTKSRQKSTKLRLTGYLPVLMSTLLKYETFKLILRI